jgi:peptidoglycan hydrolase-like protein with peptidoglycan-binding domain
MVGSAASDGVTLGATGTWRTYDQQVALFRQRYTTTPGEGKKKTWQGVDYWKIPKVAGAATPGTSNHGLGLAVDLSAPRQPKQWLTDKELSWLAENGPEFGFWNTVKDEVWHWAYCLGDQVLDAVAAAEAKLGITPPTGGAGHDPAPSIDTAAVAFTAELGRGASGAEVAAVQRKLAAAGYTVETNGELGQRTENAVTHFQKVNGQREDGRVDEALWVLLGLPANVVKATSDSSPTARAQETEGAPAGFTAPFGLGSAGGAVAAVQAKLAAAGYTVETNGEFGERTKKAVTHFQKANGHDPTGQVDEALWRLLDLS